MSDLDLLVARAQAAGITRAYKLNEVPAQGAGSAYAVLGLDSGAPSGQRVGGASPSSVRRLTVQCFGTSMAALEDIWRRADAAFKDQHLTELDDDPMSVRELQTTPTRDPDTGGVLYILHTYRF